MADKHESQIETTTETRTEHKTERGPESTTISEIVTKSETTTKTEIDYKPEAESKATADVKPKPDVKPEAAAKPAPDAKPATGGADDLEALPMPDLFAKLESTKGGLTGAEAAKRLTQYGANALAEKAENPFLKFLTISGDRFRG